MWCTRSRACVRIFPATLVMQKESPVRETKKRKLRLRFSLRFLLVFMAIVSFICYRYKQRTNFQYVANEIHKRGGAVFLRCQDPEIHSKHVIPSLGMQYYKVQVPDGLGGLKTQIRTQFVPHYYKAAVYVFDINEFIAIDSHSKFRMIDFLSGSHSDVNFGAISVPASSADKDMIRLLSRIKGLEEILLTTDYSFFEAERSEHLELIRVNFPKVSLYSRGLEWPDECPPSEIDERGFCPNCLAKYQIRRQLFEPNQPLDPQSRRSTVKCRRCGYEHSFQSDYQMWFDWKSQLERSIVRIRWSLTLSCLRNSMHIRFTLLLFVLLLAGCSPPAVQAQQPDENNVYQIVVTHLAQQMLYWGFNTLPRSVFLSILYLAPSSCRPTWMAARITRTLCGFRN